MTIDHEIIDARLATLRNGRLPVLWPADVVGVQSRHWIGRLILHMQAIKTGAAALTHLAGVDRDPWLIESVGHVRRVNVLGVYGDAPIMVWRQRHWSLAQRQAIAARWRSVVNQPYGYLRLILAGIDSLIPGQRYPLTGLAGLDHFKVCSSLIAWGTDKETGTNNFGLPWRAVTPDSAHDWCRAHPEDWELAYTSLATRAGG